MKILVTGGAGFIGSHLSMKLRRHGHDVHIIDFDDKITDDMKNKYTCHGYDLSKKEWIKNVGHFDYVFHIAAQSGGRPSLDDPQTDCLWNCLATANVVDFCRQTKPKKVFYTSSMAVYGNAMNVTEYTPPDPISFYGVSKLAGENYIKLLSLYDIPYTIFRLFATYGSGQDLQNLKQGIVSIYLSYALKDNVIPITGKKDRVRQLVHVDDVCDAMYMCLLLKYTDNETYNIVNEEVCTPEFIINTISKHLKKELTINEIDGYLGDQTYITGKSDKIRKIGWCPKYDLDHGVREFVEKI